MNDLIVVWYQDDNRTIFLYKSKYFLVVKMILQEIFTLLFGFFMKVQLLFVEKTIFKVESFLEIFTTFLWTKCSKKTCVALVISQLPYFHFKKSPSSKQIRLRYESS